MTGSVELDGCCKNQMLPSSEITGNPSRIDRLKRDEHGEFPHISVHSVTVDPPRTGGAPATGATPPPPPEPHTTCTVDGAPPAPDAKGNGAAGAPKLNGDSGGGAGG